MWKKFLLVLFIFLLVGCNSEKVTTVKKASSDSKTYLFFENFDISNYYISFWDRNVSKNDDTKIIFARKDDKYYYEIDGSIRQAVIQKDGVRYNIDFDNLSYYKAESDLEDFSLGIIPPSIDLLKTSGYKTGTQKVYNVKYVFEEYHFESGDTTYYFKGKKLVYVKYKNALKEVFLKFNEMDNKVSEKMFDINDELTEVTY